MLMSILVTLHIFAIFCALVMMFIIYWRVVVLLQSITRHVV